MKNRRWLYGFMGFLSLIGFIGVFSDEKIFLFFFAFVVHFEYLFIKSDEMLVEYMNRSASKAFYLGMISMALVTLYIYFVNESTGSEALVYGFACSWIVSIIVHGILVAYYSIRENRGLEHDNQ